MSLLVIIIDPWRIDAGTDYEIYELDISGLPT